MMKTSDFNHDIDVLKDNNGCLVVFHKNQNFELEQIVIDRDDFEKWFTNSSNKLFKESIREIISEVEERKYPEMWFLYLDVNSYKDFLDHSQEMGIWGVPGIVKSFRQLHRFRDIKKGDLVLFIARLRTDGRGGRVKLNKFRGKFEKAFLHRINSDYYFYQTKMWSDKGRWKGETFPHRFKFDTKPILELYDINISRLSYTTKYRLNKLIHTLLWQGESNALVDIISKSKIRK